MSANNNYSYNYFELIRSFEESMRYHEIGSAERSLWYRLAYEWNKLFYKEKKIIISEEELRCPIKLSHNAFIRARKKLIEERYIEHIPMGGRSAAAYKLHYLPVSLKIESAIDEEDTENDTTRIE